MGITSRILELLRLEQFPFQELPPTHEPPGQTDGSVVHIGAPPVNRPVDGRWADQSLIREDVWQLEKVGRPLYHVTYSTLSSVDAAGLETTFDQFFQALNIEDDPEL